MVMLNVCFLSVIVSGIALICGYVKLQEKDKATERYIASLESENRRLKNTVALIERKANGDKLVYTASLYNQ